MLELSTIAHSFAAESVLMMNTTFDEQPSRSFSITANEICTQEFSCVEE